MKHIVFKCRKCGYSIEIPEKTDSVLCGKCAAWNSPRSLFAALDQSAGEEEKGSILQKVPGKVFSEIPDSFPVPEKKDQSQEKENVQEKPGRFSFVTVLFVIAPVISILMAKFKLPPAIAFLVIAVVLIVYTLAKKRS